MKFQRSFLLPLLFSISLFHLLRTAAVPDSQAIEKSKLFIYKSCKSTPYPDTCNNSLSRFAGKIQQSPLSLAIAATDSTGLEFQPVFAYILNHAITGMARCVENIDTGHRDVLNSGKLLNNLKSPVDIITVESWINAALRGANSCVDDIRGVKDVGIKTLK